MQSFLSKSQEDPVLREILAGKFPPKKFDYLSRLTAGAHWRALLHGRLVADFLIDRLTVHINLKQAKKEVEDKISIDERGWQDALEEIYPPKANEIKEINTSEKKRDFKSRCSGLP